MSAPTGSRRSRRLPVSLAAAAAILSPALLGGCSEVVGLAAGGSLSEAVLSAATVDALGTLHIPVGVKPVCVVSTTNAGNYTCNGKTVAGEPVVTTVTDGQSSNTNPHMAITVAGKSVFNGEIAPVLNNAMVVSQ